MSDFDEAIRAVHDALSQMRETGAGAKARASRKSLEALRRAKPPAGVAKAETVVKKPAEVQQTPAPASSAPETSRGVAAPPALGDKAARLAALAAIVAPCPKCPHLARTRTQTVFGVGNPDAELMLVGEAPGAEEDRQGEPFVGRAGELLTKIIVAMGFTREEVFLANVLKCRPDMPPGASGNRRPTPAEMETCLPYLREQIGIVQPRVLVALGAVAMEGLLGRVEPMRALRGKWHEFHGIPLMATYHPAYLLRNQQLGEKRKVWEDMLQVLERLGKPISAKQRGFFLPK